MGSINVGQENSVPIDIYYEDHGSGKPVVLIHGFPLSGRSWEKQSLYLLNSGYRVITYDRRGFGESSKPTIGYDYDTFAADLDKIMSELDLRDVTLVGFSMGSGEVARYLGKYGSDRVDSAVIISGLLPFLLKTPDNPGGVDQGVFDQIIDCIKKDRLEYLVDFLSNFYNVDVYGEDVVSNEVFQFSWNTASEASPKGTLDCVSSWLTDFREDVARIDVPVLIMHGDADRVLPIQATAIRLHDVLHGSRCVVINGGPHGIIWTHADKVNAELVSFLNEQSRAIAA